MLIGERLRELREHRHMSQGDIERRTGLLRCYISRVENGHTVPAIETLEKLCHALDLPLYQLFYEENGGPPVNSELPSDNLWGSRGAQERMLLRFRRALGRASERDRQLLLNLAQRMLQRKRSQAQAARGTARKS